VCRGGVARCPTADQGLRLLQGGALTAASSSKRSKLGKDLAEGAVMTLKEPGMPAIWPFRLGSCSNSS
jgi:hypothetical protein